MLSIPVHELVGKAKVAVSPLALSRSDNIGVRRNNIKLFAYRNSENSYRRAFWNPGVGLWQLDTAKEVVEWSHADRANVVRSGIVVARIIQKNYCKPGQNYYAGWFACGTTGQICKSTYLDIYRLADDSLDVKAVATPGAVGLETVEDLGLVDRLCRWTDTGEAFECSIYDTGSIFPTGFLTNAVTGSSNQFEVGSKTPLSAPFISFFHNDSMRKYAVWPAKCAGYSRTIIRSVPMDKDVRYSPELDYTNYVFINNEKGRKDFLTHANKNLPVKDTMLVNNQLKSEGWFDNVIVHTDNKVGTVTWDLQILIPHSTSVNQNSYKWVTTNNTASSSYACNDF